MWQGRSFLFFPTQVIQDPVYDLLLFNAGYDLHSAPAIAANLYFNIENAFQSLRPGHCYMTLCRCPYLCISDFFQLLATPGRCDPSAPAVVWGQDAVVTGEIDSGLWTRPARPMPPGGP